ncbi:glycoside hydrolase family 65 protein [Actinomycetospora lemnae]|uniref:Glycoside hydrolase family 65 protein n=1 Tax=Actinomycetospora lemnae TaxID=3019891 RepID=A0ABT5T1U9_9PSEU|nr:glycosyl hydrolase family 65 protein [Actinomycetospora sp. DW7H6]MDD7967923.1 glycoside hydrolase family 65 protein [Actinomycetospora sp. DW7H6]
MTEPDMWTLVLDGWDPADEGRREALCTLGNGYLGTRGALPESSADGVHYPGTYAAGVFNRLSDVIDGVAVENESMVNLPNWLDLRIAVEDGAWLDLASVRVLEHREQLDTARGVLHRTTRFVDGAGRHSRLDQRRFVHRERRHLAGLHTAFVAEDWSGRLTVASGVDGTVTNSGVARYRHLSGRHLEVLTAEETGDDTVLLIAATTQSRHRIAVGARTRVTVPVDTPVARVPDRAEGRIGHRLTLEVRAGEAVEIEKIAAVVTSRDVAIAEPGLAATALLAEAPGFEELLAEHTRSWGRLWRRCRIEVLDGTSPPPVETVRDLRLAGFHVLQTVSRHDLDLDAGIPARGLHGEAYRGHVFWDELFVLPVLVLRFPALARALLLYRVRRLDAARRAARAAGHRGAMFPWQSGSDGREESQRLHLNPLSGRWLPDVSDRQRHIGLAVAHNLWQYVQATGDLAFLTDEGGAEVLLEVARFFADLAEHDPADGRFHIRGVMGPDEYTTRYPGSDRPGIDDNAYTNVLTVWVLQRARELLDLLPPSRRDELTATLDLGPAELRHWREVGERMAVPIHPDGVISQFAGYRDLPELDWDAYRRRYGDLQRLDRILEAEGRSVDDYQASKQADVLMLFYLFSADELRDLLGGLGYALPPEAIPRTIDHYLARTAHGSTLSALVHAWVLARAHREEALDHFDRVVRSDVADLQGGTTAEGVHLGAMAGAVDVVQRCFAGVETRGDVLRFNPHWPGRFGVLELALQYRGRPLTARVTDREVCVSADAGPGGPVRVAVGDEIRDLWPGETVRLRVPGASGVGRRAWGQREGLVAP